MEIMKTTLNCN